MASGVVATSFHRILPPQLVWYAPLDTLWALKDRGFLLSISEVALTER
jgi:hypothetical protein